MSTAADGPTIRRLSVLIIPSWMRAEPAIGIERKAFAEDIAKVERNSARQRLQRQYAKQATDIPGSAFRNWPAPEVRRNDPLSDG